MFGGIAFMLAGNMACGVSSRDLIVSLDPEEPSARWPSPTCARIDMTGRPMRGWILSLPKGIDDDADLAGWVDAGRRLRHLAAAEVADGRGLTLALVARRRRLPDLPALLPGLRRRRRRRPAPGSPRGSTTSPGSASTRSGSRRSTPRRWPTAATTSATTRRRPRLRHARGLRRAGRGVPRAAAPRAARPRPLATPRSSTPGSASTPTGTSGPTATRPPNNWLAAFGGPAWSRDPSAAAAGTCTPSIPSSPTSTGATPRSARRSRGGPLLARARRRRLPPRRDRAG